MMRTLAESNEQGGAEGNGAQVKRTTQWTIATGTGDGKNNVPAAEQLIINAEVAAHITGAGIDLFTQGTPELPVDGVRDVMENPVGEIEIRKHNPTLASLLLRENAGGRGTGSGQSITSILCRYVIFSIQKKLRLVNAIVSSLNQNAAKVKAGK